MLLFVGLLAIFDKRLFEISPFFLNFLSGTQSLIRLYLGPGVFVVKLGKEIFFPNLH